MEQLEEELADVVIYCLSMVNETGMDLTNAVLNKLERNRRKYPSRQYYGKAHDILNCEGRKEMFGLMKRGRRREIRLCANCSQPSIAMKKTYL